MRVNVGAIPEEAFDDRYASRTRTVVSQFMHVHYVRVKNLQNRGKEFLGDLARQLQPPAFYKNLFVFRESL